MNKNFKNTDLTVELISNTINPLKVIADSARITRDINASHLTNEQYFHMLYKMGHLSVMEHIAFSFRISGISRACSHQLVRFRIGTSFTQRSQRYTNESSLSVITPKSIQKNKKALRVFEESINQLHKAYSELLSEGIPKEDARFILPNATSTSIIMTMNFRELIHASGLRLCSKAQWEIQELFFSIKKEISSFSPFLGRYLQSKCVHNGLCSEIKPCKTTEQIKREWEDMQIL
ncbi:MAG: FAD-dependent thymidylate synthase [Caldisericia bacterium]|nr:FAD-dependent thymidylate synthase [Caldisericia bacterium]